MIVSMTGYGRTKFTFNNKNITLELKSLNSKQADVSLRIPSYYREKESEIRESIISIMQRGKIDFAMYVELGGANVQTSINQELASHYLSMLSEICRKNNIEPGPELMVPVLHIPEVTQSNNEVLGDEEWHVLKSAIDNTLQQLQEFRIHEGNVIGADIIHRVEKILSLILEVEIFEPERILHIREKLAQQLDELQRQVQTDPGRLEQELIFYIEKLDITEEKVRLKKHCEYFLATCRGDEMAGRKLGFIAQEMGREINTLGSKANNSEIQMLVVQMKDELEKIKEQLLNVL